MGRRLIRAAALTAVGTLVAFACLALPTPAAWDIARVVDGEAAARADPGVGVVEIDRRFITAATRDNSLWAELVTSVLLRPTEVLVIEPDALAAARRTYDTVTLESEVEAPTVDAALIPFVQQAGNAVLGYEAEATGLRSGTVTVDATFGDPALADAVAATGAAPVQVSDDGLGQLLEPLAVRLRQGAVEGTLLPSTATATVARLWGAEGIPELVARPGRVRLAGRSIPVEEGLGLRVHYSDDLLPGGSQVITASELISGERPYEDLDGNVVVFGTHEGAAGSRPIAAPVDGGRVAPVYATANAVNTMLTGQYLRREQAGTSLAVAAVAALLAALAWVFAPWWVAAPLCAAFVLGWQRWVEARLADGRIFSLLAPVAAVATVTVIALGIAWVGRVRHRRRVRSLFARYVPGRVASRLLEGDLAEELSAGRRQDAAALFVDLRGFTPLAAMLDPAQVRQVLDRFYQFVADRVLAEDGTVVQFTGDEVYAVFGAPLARADHAKAALTVACRLQDDRAELDESLAELGVRPVGFGIGVNAGPVVAAHVGTNTRTQYSVLGDTVNVASRLCSLAAAGQIVTAAATLAGGGADATGDGDEPAADGFHPVGERSLKGVREPVALVRRGPGPLRGDPGAGADSLQVTSGP